MKAPKMSGGGLLEFEDPIKSNKKLSPKEWQTQNESAGYLKDPTERGQYPHYYNPKEYFIDPNGGYTKLEDKGKTVDYSNDKNYKPLIKYVAPVEVKKNNKMVAPENNRKPIVFGNGYNFDPNTNKYYNPTTGEEIATDLQQYNNGGLVKKTKGYAGGGGIKGVSNDTVNSYVDVGSQAANLGAAGLTASNQGDANGKVNVNKSTGAGALAGAGQGAKLGATIGTLVPIPGASLIGAGIGAAGGAVIGGITGNKKAKQTNQEIQNQLDTQKAEEERLKQEQLRIKLANTQSQQMIDNSAMGQGYADGGKIEGKGTAKSDSITAKVKKGSFVVPAENKVVAEVIREKVLKAPSIKKANLKQKGGEDVKLSNGEHLFTPKEVEKIENKLGDNILNALAPLSAANEDRVEGEKNEFAGGGGIKAGKVSERKNSSGNKDFDKELDAIAKKDYTNAKDVNGDIEKLQQLQQKYISLYGKRSPEIDLSTQKLHVIKPNVEKIENKSALNSKINNEIESTKKLLKENGATDSEILGYETRMKGTDRFSDNKRNDIKSEILNNINNRSAKGSSDATKEELKTKANSFYNRKLLDATKQLEVAKANSKDYTNEQIKGFQKNIDDAKEKILSVNNAVKNGGMQLVQARDVYRKESGYKPEPISAPKTTQKSNEPPIQTNTLNENAPVESINKNVTDPLNINNPPPTLNEVKTLKAPSAKTVAKKQTTVAPTPNGLTVEQMRQVAPAGLAGDAGENSAPPSVVPEQNLATQGLGKTTAPTGTSIFDAPEQALDNSLTQQPDNIGSTPDAKADWGKILGTGLSALTNYGLPLLQTGMGLNYLHKAGKRPVDKIDQDYLNGIATSKGIVDKANARATYGFSPEEMSALNMDNADQTNAQRFAARNYSGGSSANAYNMERNASNDSYGRGLLNKVNNRNLQLSKQQYADSKQSELNNLLSDKANRSRQLFGDTMNAFQQNQQAGSNLVGAGIQNLIGAGRYQKELEASSERNNKYNPQYGG